jgi:glycosyltransferase involved in cell wall biosynthesis
VKIDFALITITGNATRFAIAKREIKNFGAVKARFIPIRTWFEGDFLSFLPGGIRLRLRHFIDSVKVFDLRNPDAVVLHAFELSYIFPVFARFFRRKTVVVNNPDAPIFPMSLFDPNEPGIGWLRRFVRTRLVPCAIERTDLFVPWSATAARELRAEWPEIPENKIVALHPGIEIEKWPYREPRVTDGLFKVLFVGGDLRRKGLDVLLKSYSETLRGVCELHICTMSSSLANDPDIASMLESFASDPNVYLHLDLKAVSPELISIYRDADVLVLPTRLDQIPWVLIEALASGIPVVSTKIRAIPDIVIEGETGLLVPVDDPSALGEAILRLQKDDILRNRLIVRGRDHVENTFCSKKNTSVLIEMIERAVEQKRLPRPRK